MAEPDLNQKSETLFKRAQNVLPAGVNSPVRAFNPCPFFVEAAKGSRLYTADGDAYIDYCMAYGPLLLGHAFEGVLDVARKQLTKGTLYGAPTENEVQLAELVSELFPSMEMLRLVNSGTEATMHAIRLARGFTGKKKIIKFEGCYHGAHDYVLVKAGSGATSCGSPDSLGIPEETTRNTIILPYNNIAAVEQTVKREGDDLAAVIVEPVIGNAGVILPDRDYLNRLRQLTEDYGVLLIFDEVITGFRLALGGAQQRFKITPDLTTLGKILGGGFPIGAFGGRKEIMQQLSPLGKVYQAGTFSGNPVSVSTGLAVLQTLRRKQDTLYPSLERDCEQLTKALADSAATYAVDVQVNSIASMFQLFFTSAEVNDYVSAKSSDTQKFSIYFHELLKQGIFIPPSQFETCFLSAAHTQEDLDRTMEAFDSALHAVSTGGGTNR